jgi:mannose-6-phosphate isomerase
MGLFALEASILRHAWGSPIAIPALFGWSSDGQPIAELWYGDHPRAPAMVFDADGPRPLGELVAETPALRGGLGFLLKLLGIAAPLSLQTHPDAAQAARGFADEEARGVPFDDRARRYADPHAKHEMIVALTRFEALAGVRAAADLRATAARAGLRSLDAILPAADGDVAAFVRALFALEPARQAAALAEAAAADPGAVPWLAALVAQYPRDVAALAPIFLEHVELAPGEAMHLAPGVLHAYLGGLALELTGPSDNVLRAGLTGKHVDVAAALAIADLHPRPVARVEPTIDHTRRRYAPAGAGLRLDLVELDGATTVPPGAVAIVVGLAGYVLVAGGGAERALGAGDGILVTPDVGVALTGRGRIVIAAAG